MFRFIACLVCLVAGAFGHAGAQPPAPMPVPERVEGKVVVLTTHKIAIQEEGNNKPVELQFSDVLRTNSVPKEAGNGAIPHEGWGYRPCDVQMGDVVEIITETRNDGKFVCEAITIRRRPGGKVPEAPNEKFDPKRPQLSHAYRMNAHQALEEKGIPLPDCLLAPWAPERRAPMPREAKPK